MIEVSGLSKRFGDTQALSDVSFKVEKGQIVGFLGANGAGKTTTMDILCGCIGADSGKAMVAGYDITEEPLKAKAKLGYLPDEPPLHLEMRVRDYIEYAARLHGVRSNLKEKVDRVIDRLSIRDVQHRIIGNLSKGYRQRVALAQAIVHEPEVLVLDEPTEGLDPNQIAQIRELIRSLAGEHTIILSSHILSEVQNTCDQIIIINKGRIIQQGTYDELAAQAQAGRVYRLKVARNADELSRKLGELNGVGSPKCHDGEIEFAVSRDDETVLDQVAKRVVDGGYGLRELALKTRSLEDVFLELTQ